MSEHNDHISSLQKPITGRHVLIAMIAFFGVIVTVNMTMAVFASRSWTGLEVKNSYVASQDYNAKLAVVARQKALGWSSTLSQVAGEFRLQLVNSAGAGIAGARVDGLMKRPVQASDDTSLTFREVASGDYRAIVPDGKGVWDVDLNVHAPAGETYRQIFRIHLKD